MDTFFDCREEMAEEKKITPGSSGRAADNGGGNGGSRVRQGSPLQQKK